MIDYWDRPASRTYLKDLGCRPWYLLWYLKPFSDGTLGWNLVLRISSPYLMAVKHIFGGQWSSLHFLHVQSLRKAMNGSTCVTQGGSVCCCSRRCVVSKQWWSKTTSETPGRAPSSPLISGTSPPSHGFSCYSPSCTLVKTGFSPSLDA